MTSNDTTNISTSDNADTHTDANTTTTSNTEFPHLQDVFGHLMRWKLFTPICLCYDMPDPDPSLKPKIIATLRAGLDKLVLVLPWLGGQVTLSSVNKRPTVVTGQGRCELVVKDLSSKGDGDGDGDVDGFPSMSELKNVKFPFRLLDANILTPINTFPTSWDAPPVPVFLVQATFIPGGMILCIIGEHSTMDGVGLASIASMLSRLCEGGATNDEEIQWGNRDRRDIIPLHDVENWKAGSELDHFFVPEHPPMQGYEMPACEIGYFHFPADALKRLKAEAATATEEDIGNANGDGTDGTHAVAYTSTNDAITAFIWKHVTMARTHNAALPPSSSSLLIRAVDARSALSIPPTYLGNTTHHTYTTLHLTDASSTPVSRIARTLRRALNPAELAYNIRSLATLLSTAEDKSRIYYGADIFLPRDIWLSSWMRLDLWRLTFGLGLGMPVAVRKPRLEMVEGLMYLMPLDREGGVDAAVCLSRSDMQRLKEDEGWMGVAGWVG